MFGWRSGLPDAGDEAVAGTARVFLVAGELGAEGAVFEGGAGDDDEGGGEHGEEGPGGAEDERPGGEHQYCPYIHGVADVAIGAGGDDRVAAVGLDADGGLCEGVDAHHPDNQCVTEEVERKAGKRSQAGSDDQWRRPASSPPTTRMAVTAGM